MELGKIQELYIVKQVKFGVYLAEENLPDASEKVLLPQKQVPEGASAGDKLSVFLYKDSDDRIIATVRAPRLTAGQTALPVKTAEVCASVTDAPSSGQGRMVKSAAAVPV